MRLCKPVSHITTNDMRRLGELLGAINEIGQYEKSTRLTHGERHVLNDFRTRLILDIGTLMNAESYDSIPF